MEKPATSTQRLRSAAGVAADVPANNKTSAISDYKTSGNAGILALTLEVLHRQPLWLR
jgi:hypothetical protein